MTDVILAVDTGSSSMRGILFGNNGETLHTYQIRYTMEVGADGSAVMDATVFSDCLMRILQDAARQIREQGYRLCGIALDSQRSSVLAVDRYVKPLHPILMWYDKRCSDICTGFSQQALQRIYRLCGMRLTPVSSAPKMLWMKQNLPHIYRAADKLIGIHDYLLYILTGMLQTDASCACRTALMDIRTFQWSEELVDLFGLDADKLCPILRPGSPAGILRRELAGQLGLPLIPVISGGGDQQCCLLGQHDMQQGTVSINSGSASYLSVALAEPVFDPKMEVNLSAYHGNTPWLLEAANMGSGTVYQWFNRIFYHPESDCKDLSAINADISQEPPGANDLICFADFAGRGCPETDPCARGAFFGVGLQHTRASFARAVLEGICFDIYDCICHMQNLGVEISSIHSTGGLSSFPVFNQILADISGLPVFVSKNTETTAAGAYRSAVRALGWDCSFCRCEGTHFHPVAVHTEKYRELLKKRSLLRNNGKSFLYKTE